MDSSNLADKLMANLNKKFGEGSIKEVKDSSELLNVPAWIDMPAEFKKATGGSGIPCGHISQIVGESDTGKTTIVIEAMKGVEKAGGFTIFLDAEHKFDLERYRKCGGNPSSVKFIDAEYLETGWNVLRETVEQLSALKAEAPDTPFLVVWDSLPFSVPEKISNSEAENAHVAVEAKINNKEVRKVRSKLKNSNVAFLIVNHSYEEQGGMSFVKKEIVKGGKELYFGSLLVVKTQKRKTLKRAFKGDDNEYGMITKIKTLKSHAGSKSVVELAITNHGYLTPEELEQYQGALKGKSPEDVMAQTISELGVRD